MNYLRRASTLVGQADHFSWSLRDVLVEIGVNTNGVMETTIPKDFRNSLGTWPT